MRRLGWWCRALRSILGHQTGNLYKVVVEDPEAAPGSCAFDSIHPRSVPSEVALQAADPTFAPGPPLHEPSKGSSPFEGPPSSRRFTHCRQYDTADAKIFESSFDLVFHIATIRRHGAWHLAEPRRDPDDRRHKLGGVIRIAHLDVVVDDDAVGIVDELGLVAELDRLAEPALSDRTGIGVVQRDKALRAVGVAPERRCCSCEAMISARVAVISRSEMERTTPRDEALRVLRLAFRTTAWASLIARVAMRARSALINATSSLASPLRRRRLAPMSRERLCTWRVRSRATVRGARPDALIAFTARAILATPLASRPESVGYATFASTTVVSARTRFVFSTFD